ncbi:class I SAM-dependent methyltransferase [Thermodesulfobacteriota bacterium]
MQEITYGTVKEYNRFIQDFPDITPKSGDLKDFQRPWMAAAIIAKLRKGRILEIGASQCEIADFLQKRGYDVSVIDPYDRRAGGGSNYAAIQKKYPLIHVHKGLLHLDSSLPSNHFDAVHSCSVVEHIELQDQQATCDKILELLKPNGFSIHAIDFTIDGIMQNHDRLSNFIRCHGVNFDLHKLAERAKADVDTFCLSPQGHYRWRQSLKRTYEQYSYRKVISLNFVFRKA